MGKNKASWLPDGQVGFVFAKQEGKRNLGLTLFQK